MGMGTGTVGGGREGRGLWKVGELHQEAPRAPPQRPPMPPLLHLRHSAATPEPEVPAGRMRKLLQLLPSLQAPEVGAAKDGGCGVGGVAGVGGAADPGAAAAAGSAAGGQVGPRPAPGAFLGALRSSCRFIPFSASSLRFFLRPGLTSPPAPHTHPGPRSHSSRFPGARGIIASSPFFSLPPTDPSLFPPQRLPPLEADRRERGAVD